MSDSNKPDLARGWRRAQKLVDEEAHRLAEMSDEEFEREMAKMPDPEHVPSAQELLDRARARQQAQGGASEAEGGSSDVDKSGTKVRALRARPPRRVPPVAWMGLAAAAGALVVLGLQQMHPVIVTKAPDDASPEDRQQAEVLRREAFAACDARKWLECERKLVEAKGLDAQGDADSQVQRRHKEALEGMAREEGSRGGGG